MCIHLLTQKANSRKENRAINAIESGRVNELDVIHQMAKDTMAKDPVLDATTANLMAISSLMYAKQVKDGETPISNAVKSLQGKKKSRASLPTPFTPESPLLV